ncbi:(deoxy)nucleoside triphosphate pyrophosphohydrolase [Salipaludibacillus daqingensis]|uniref:(deoxy)nucleoside triphosphate pyrophosphohydrolase n=1 Tax=Salipaludibacillus daqingensis TaxID=3041001 RepID=UPI0024739CAF|nr:(deoxy)nucleoside triphosphate pyrophosphohydrolase [Salipaludibacillus daqingensis]
MKKVIHVVGTVIMEGGKILCAHRGSEDRILPLMWEFPGGKVESEESPEEALKREIYEEMRCQVEVGDQLKRTIYEYDFGIVELTTFYAMLIEGEPTLTEHEKIAWLSPGELRTIEWAPADLPAVEKLVNLMPRE